MKYLFLLGFCAVIFLLCFLIDKLIQKLFPKHKLEKSKTVVRPPRKSAVFGVLLLVFPLMALLFWMPEEGDTEIIQVVTTVRCDPRKGLISKESPFGKQVLGKKVGDRFTVQVSESYSYVAEIRSITKTEDDGSAPLMQY